MANAETLQREKQVRSEVEKEIEIDRLRRKLERSVVDEYYVRGVQSPQASIITKTFGANSQDSQGVTTSAGSAFVVISPGVSTQSTPAKPSVAPMQLDTQSRLVQ